MSCAGETINTDGIRECKRGIGSSWGHLWVSTTGEKASRREFCGKLIQVRKGHRGVDRR